MIAFFDIVCCVNPTPTLLAYIRGYGRSRKCVNSLLLDELCTMRDRVVSWKKIGLPTNICVRIIIDQFNSAICLCLFHILDCDRHKTLARLHRLMETPLIIICVHLVSCHLFVDNFIWYWASVSNKLIIKNKKLFIK